MTTSNSRSRVLRFACAAGVAVLATVGVGRVVSAHTDFVSSEPADGAVVDAPLSEVVIDFTNPARPAGDEFELLTPDGSIVVPTSVDETDGTSFVLGFDPPLEAGTYGVRWSVQAGDAHPIAGSFRFEVAATAPAAEGTDESSSAVVPTATMPDGMDGADHSAMTATDHAMDEFLDVGAAGAESASIGRAGRVLSIAGLIFGAGVLAALVWTVRGDRDEITALLNWVRLAGLVVFTGGLIEFSALAAADPAESLRTLLTTDAGLAALLKMVGGAAVMVGIGPRVGRIVAPAHSLSAAVAEDVTAMSVGASPRPDRSATGTALRWAPTTTAIVGLAGWALVFASFWFDGHTVTTGPRLLHVAANAVHLGAAAVWGGGVFAMTAVAWMRRRRSERIGLAPMVVRFSSSATVALVAVIVAGLAMTWMVIEGPGDLFGTSWGRVLVAKVAVVAVAAGLGGYNHVRLRPALQQRPDDPGLARELRISLSIESAAFAVVVVLTAILVAAAI